MKSKYITAILIAITMFSCNRSVDHSTMNHNGDQTLEEGPNQTLYNQMMDVHDEVMPKMDNIMKLKRALQEQIEKSPDMLEERKHDLENIISNLDSASNAMMSWMHRLHEFNPLADSIDQEKAREYLESEMEEIKRVKELINESIEQAKTEVEKQK